MKTLLANFTIKAKLVALSLVSIGMILLLSLVGWGGYQSIDKERQVVAEVQTLETSLELLLRGIGEHILTEGSSAAQEIVRRGGAQAATSVSGIGGDLEKQWLPVQKGAEEFLKMRGVSPSDDAALLKFGKLSSDASDFLGKVQKIEVASRERAEATEKNVTITAVVIVVLALAAIATLSLLTYASTVPSMENLVRTMVAVERNNDLSLRVEATGKDETAQLATTFNALLTTLQGALRQILSSVDKVSDASHALSSSSIQVSASSNRQSEAAAAMAASIEEVTVSISQVSENAHKALEISRESGELSIRGGTIIHNTTAEIMNIAATVHQVSTNIEDLGQQSNQVSSIVQTIKDVAEQTNLLALNAAIEAARAGEQGRGFAVVADEVRKLAERTTQATVEITRMIGAMQHSAHTAVDSMGSVVTQVQDGVALAKQAGEAINQINQGAGQVINVVGDISAALTEQNSASHDISAHVENVAQMSEKNSAAVGEIASAANHLDQLASAMREAVNEFRI
ncbi:MAG: methyl-accepting chemotaxis protein [Sulfuritalea sp.]|nr:methyl-accepting chemotaxis protein [Sulfuritalea sp.]